ncbi:sigma-54 interaction domain-containing protein [Pseudomonas helleri]|uniref:AAA domain-containing protein n=1 Tax=Pseudomonas helleri TaxID=1608996 RepID=A0A6A7YWD4_9PSED|nr:sigma 54-interacting transcriptional regulator [Pseudomonas helleri]MQT26410.1 AAA domain-containing protein [Pseudomonas helleri]MQT81341.1 AAA domain-containing protein [Pseudomonas helleri]MQU17710.1 AAA domain-containing protein [Pseudomonas helleri]
MFAHVSQPLAYAELLLEQFSCVARAGDAATAGSACVRALVALAGCELGQLYLLDASHKRLERLAECCQGQGTAQPQHVTGVPVDYTGEQLLQFALCQNRVVCISDLSAGVYDLGFLPQHSQPWRSLLCVPLVNAHNAVEGLLLAASHEAVDLQGYAPSLGALGGFTLMQHRVLQQGVKALSPPERSITPTGLMGKSAVMRHTYGLINKVIHSPYTVLLLGETGTGKEVIARMIHDASPRHNRPFIVQNCAAFPENLLESELFGYRKGAFTGADRDRVGLFDAACGGTLLLDEIGDMPLSLQAKLLRVLQEGEIRPLGCNDSHKIDVRIIAATHRNLTERVSQGQFREDLYYRLAQFPIELAPLREREGDLLELARHFADKACQFLQRKPVRWSDEALALLTGYAFPGNVRELKGLVERAVLLSDGSELQAQHFSLRSDVSPGPVHLNLRARMEHVERGLLLDCLRKHAGNQTRAAHELGVARRTLLYRLERLNIVADDLKAMAS